MNRTETFYAPSLGRMLLLALEEVAGPNAAAKLLDKAVPDEAHHNSHPDNGEGRFGFESISRLQSALEEEYGERSGRGLALKVGRSAFKYGLKEYGASLGLTEIAFRLLPHPARLRLGIRSIAEFFNRHSDQEIIVEEQDGQMLWQSRRCPLCWERKAETPICHAAVGLLQEALYWLSGGKFFSVEETACISRGDPACLVRIDLTPIS